MKLYALQCNDVLDYIMLMLPLKLYIKLAQRTAEAHGNVVGLYLYWKY